MNNDIDSWHTDAGVSYPQTCSSCLQRRGRRREDLSTEYRSAGFADSSEGVGCAQNVDRSTLEYSPSQGYRLLRNALVNYYDRYQIELSADDIIITCGGSEAVN